MLKMYTCSAIFIAFMFFGLCQSVLCIEFDSNEAKLAYRVTSAKEWDFKNKDPLLDYHEVLFQKGTKVNLRLCSNETLLKAISRNPKEVFQVQSFVRNVLKYSSEQLLISHSRDCIQKKGKMSLIEIWVCPQNSELPGSDEVVEGCQLDSMYKHERIFKNMKKLVDRLPIVTRELKNNPHTVGIIRSYFLSNKEIMRLQNYFSKNELSPKQYLIQNIIEKKHSKNTDILLILAKLDNSCIK